MRVSVRFPLAVHSLMLIAAFSDTYKITSDLISKSTGANAVIIRGIFSNLKKANILSVSPGPGCTTLARSVDEITLWDIYTAIETEKTDEIFKFHTNISPLCPVGISIYDLLISHLDDAIIAMKEALSSTTLSMLLQELSQTVPKLSIPDLFETQVRKKQTACINQNTYFKQGLEQ